MAKKQLNKTQDDNLRRFTMALIERVTAVGQLKDIPKIELMGMAAEYDIVEGKFPDPLLWIMKVTLYVVGTVNATKH